MIEHVKFEHIWNKKSAPSHLIKFPVICGLSIFVSCKKCKTFNSLLRLPYRRGLKGEVRRAEVPLRRGPWRRSNVCEQVRRNRRHRRLRQRRRKRGEGVQRQSSSDLFHFYFNVWLRKRIIKFKRLCRLLNYNFFVKTNLLQKIIQFFSFRKVKKWKNC